MADYTAAVERAQSRAAVLQSLQNSYGAKSGTGEVKVVVASGKQKGKIQHEPLREVAPPTDKGVVNDVIETILSAIGDQSVRTRQFFKDSLRGKAIVVENLKAQLEASKASKKIERACKRKQSVSYKAMKRLRIGDPCALPSQRETRDLHNAWWEYARHIVNSASSEAQLQAR